MKKLDDLESRLSISMDKDEIHTLGLKLRFYHNEIRNYLSRMQQIHDRIIEIQRKYGFKPEELPLSASTPPLDRAHEIRPSNMAAPPPPPPLQNNTQDAIKLLADWVMKLQKQGFSPQEALEKARDFIREGGKPKGINITLPEESAASIHREATLEDTEQDTNLAAQQQAPRKDPQIQADQEVADTRSKQDIPRDLNQHSDEEPASSVSEAANQTQESRKSTFEEMLDSIEQNSATPNTSYDQDRAPAASEPEPVEAESDPESEPTESSPRTNHKTDDDPQKETASGKAEPAAPHKPPAPPRDDALALMPLLEKWGAQATQEQLPDNFAQRLESLINSRRGEIHIAMEDLGQAQKGDRQDMNGLSGFVLFCLGYFAHRLGREGLAITTIERSLNQGCVYSLSYLVLGRCYQKKRIFEKALINFKFADKLDPGMEQARLGIANALLFLSRHEEALDYLANQSFNIEENQVESILLQSSALEKLGRLPVAVDLLEQTVESCRSISCTAACLFRLGKIKENQKDVLKAIDLFEETVESDPDHLEARYTLGRLYMAHKAVPLARKHLYYLTRNYPDSKWADKAREII